MVNEEQNKTKQNTAVTKQGSSEGAERTPDPADAGGGLHADKRGRAGGCREPSGISELVLGPEPDLGLITAVNDAQLQCYRFGRQRLGPVI